MNNTNSHKHHINSMKSFDEFGLENCKLILIAEYPCQTESNSEKEEGGHIENDRERSQQMYCWSDLNGRLRRHRRASPSTVKKRNIENTEKYTENNKQHHENKITAS